MDQPRYTSAKYLRPGDVLCDGRRVLNTIRRRADMHHQIPERYEIVFVYDNCHHDYQRPRPPAELVPPLHRFKVKTFGWEPAADLLTPEAKQRLDDAMRLVIGDGDV